MAGLSLQEQLAAFLDTPEAIQGGALPNIVPATMGGVTMPSAASADVATAAAAAPPPVTPAAPAAPGFLEQLRTFLGEDVTQPQIVPPEVSSRLSSGEQASYGDMKGVNQARSLSRLALLGTILTGGGLLPAWMLAKTHEAGVSQAKQAPLQRALEQEHVLSTVGLQKGQKGQAEASAEHLTAEASKTKDEVAHATENRANQLTIAQAHKLNAEASMKSAEAAMKKANTDEATLYLTSAATGFKTMEALVADMGARIYGLVKGGASKEEKDLFKWYNESKPKFDIMQGLSQGGSGGLTGLGGVSVPPMPAIPTTATPPPAPAAGGGAVGGLKPGKIKVRGPAGQLMQADDKPLPPGWTRVQ